MLYPNIYKFESDMSDKGRYIANSLTKSHFVTECPLQTANHFKLQTLCK